MQPMFYEDFHKIVEMMERRTNFMSSNSYEGIEVHQRGGRKLVDARREQCMNLG